MSETPEPAFVSRVFTCHTEGCGNAGLPVTLTVPEDLGGAACGACGNPIDDVIDG